MEDEFTEVTFHYRIFFYCYLQFKTKMMYLVIIIKTWDIYNINKYIVGKYIIYLYKIKKQERIWALGELFYPVSHRVQINLIFKDNVHILCLSWNIKKSKTTAKLSENSWNKHHFQLRQHFYCYCFFLLLYIHDLK